MFLPKDTKKCEATCFVSLQRTVRHWTPHVDSTELATELTVRRIDPIEHECT